jgi:hypothetical protein
VEVEMEEDKRAAAPPPAGAPDGPDQFRAEEVAAGLEGLAALVRRVPVLARGVRRYARFVVIEAAEVLNPGELDWKLMEYLQRDLKEQGVTVEIRPTIGGRRELVAFLSPSVEFVIWRP